MKTKTTAIRLVGAAMVAVAVTPWLGGGSASAAAPPSGDARATSFEGNAVTCADAGLTGDIISVTATQDGTLIDITAIPAGKTVTGVVVKGSDAYNVYLPAKLGALPWLDLHAPLNPNGQPAGLSHWYVCAVNTTPSSPPPSSKPATTPASTPASVAPTSASASPETSVEGTKNAKPPAVLARTGSGMPLGMALAISLGLLLGGAALMFVPRGLTAQKGAHRRRH